MTDASDKEFVGINITCDEDYNYFIDQTRMLDKILEGIGMKNGEIPVSKNSRPVNVRDGTYQNDNNVRSKCTVTLRQQPWTSTHSIPKTLIKTC